MLKAGEKIKKEVKSEASFTKKYKVELTILSATFLVSFLVDYFLKLYIVSFTHFEIIKNQGISWGLGAGFLNSFAGKTIPFVVGMAIFLFLYLSDFYKRLEKINAQSNILKFCYLIGGGLVVGGAVGNLADRLRVGYVIDYFNLFGRLTMNAADLFIIIGVLLILATLYWIDFKSEKKTNA